MIRVFAVLLLYQLGGETLSRAFVLAAVQPNAPGARIGEGSGMEGRS